jgi:transcriptional antiterminator RfaH
MIKQGQERLAKENLERQGFEVYLPMHRPSMRTLRDGRLPAPRPFLPGYLFVSLDLVTAPWRKLLSTYGVRDVHMTGAGDARRPRAIPGRWIERLQAREDQHGLIVPEAPKAPPPFAKVDAKRVMILASLLGRESRVEVSLDRVSRGPVR